MCDETYAKAPSLCNEFLNRTVPSTSAARARRSLLERMVFDGHQERLGIKGFPPEYSVYQALFVEGGFYCIAAKHQDRFSHRYSSWDLNTSLRCQRRYLAAGQCSRREGVRMNLPSNFPSDSGKP